MNIMLIGDYSGAEAALSPIKVAKSLMKEFAIMGHTLTYITYYREGAIYSRIQKLFGREYISDTIRRLGIFPMIHQVLKFKPDIIQLVNAESFYLFLFPLKIFAGYKLAYFNHSLISHTMKHYYQYNYFQKFRFWTIEKVVLKYSDLVFVFTSRDARFLSRFMHVDKEKIKIVRHGCNPAKERKAGINFSNPLRLITVGSFGRKEKNLHGLLEMLSLLNFEIILTVCSPIREEKYSGKVPSNITMNYLNGLSEDDLKKEYTRHDLFVLASLYESYSLSLLEAMTTGILFLASDRTGLAEYFPGDIKELTFNHRNSADFSKKLNRIVKNQSATFAFYSKRIIEFTSGFSWKAEAAEMIKAYINCLHKKAA